MTFSGLWRINSGRVYSLRTTVPLTAIQASLLRAYPDAPPSQTIYFAERGSEDFKGYGVLDTSITYDVPIFDTLRPWIKVEIFNLFDNDKQIGWNTTVSRDLAGPRDSLGIPTGYIRGANFGRADSNAHFPAPFAGVIGGHLPSRLGIPVLSDHS